MMPCSVISPSISAAGCHKQATAERISGQRAIGRLRGAQTDRNIEAGIPDVDALCRNVLAVDTRQFLARALLDVNIRARCRLEVDRRERYGYEETRAVVLHQPTVSNSRSCS